VERNEPNEAGADMGADSRRGPGVRSGGRPEGRVTTAGPGVLAGVSPCPSGRKCRGACRAALDTPERGSSRLHKTRGSGKPDARTV